MISPKCPKIKTKLSVSTSKSQNWQAVPLVSAVQLQFGSCFFFLHLHAFIFYLNFFVVIAQIIKVHLVELFGVNVLVEISHDGEDDADAQQQAGEKQKLLPLERQAACQRTLSSDVLLRRKTRIIYNICHLATDVCFLLRTFFGLLPP